MLIERARSCLLIVDVQERLLPSIASNRTVLGRILLLMKSARRLGVPMMATEHWPENIGPLATAVKGQLGGAEMMGGTFDPALGYYIINIANTGRVSTLQKMEEYQEDVNMRLSASELFAMGAKVEEQPLWPREWTKNWQQWLRP